MTFVRMERTSLYMLLISILVVIIHVSHIQSQAVMCSINACRDNYGTHWQYCRCGCSSGYYGKTCQYRGLCSRFILCINGKNARNITECRCRCPTGYEGKGCITRKCPGLTCKNGGTIQWEDCSCKCPINYEGKQCEKHSSWCPRKVCQNNGSFNHMYCRCDCTRQYVGKTCEIRKCSGLTCPNKATIKWSDCTCYCPNEYEGKCKKDTWRLSAGWITLYAVFGCLIGVCILVVLCVIYKCTRDRQNNWVHNADTTTQPVSPEQQSVVTETYKKLDRTNEVSETHIDSYSELANPQSTFNTNRHSSVGGSTIVDVNTNVTYTVLDDAASDSVIRQKTVSDNPDNPQSSVPDGSPHFVLEQGSRDANGENGAISKQIEEMAVISEPPPAYIDVILETENILQYFNN